jgi:hypothetical protein
MAFLFKSKKNQERAINGRESTPGSQSSIQGAPGRIRDEKGSFQRSTPTGSLNSLDNEGSVGSPEQAYGRPRGPSTDQTQSQASPQLQQVQQPQQQQQQQQQQPQQPQQPSDLPVCSQLTTPPCYLSVPDLWCASLMLTGNPCLVSKPIADGYQSQFLPLSMVSATLHLYLVPSESIPSIWRRC